MNAEVFVDKYRTEYRTRNRWEKAMTSTVNPQGCLELPPEVTAQLGLKPGDRVLVETGTDQCVLRPIRPHAGLRWEGNVLVHQGVGASPSVTELRDERLNHLGEGRSG